MRQEFLQLIQKLQTDALAAVSVSNKNNFQEILKSTYGHELIQKYGSVQNYFEKLNQEGHTNLIIQEWRKNGNTKIKKGNPFEVSFSEKPQPTQPTIQPMGNIFQGLNGLNGLGFTDVLTMNTNSELKMKYEIENDFLKKENKKLEAEIFQLKETSLIEKYSRENKSATAETINSALANLPQVLSVIFQPKEAPTTGLNAPQNLSEIKNQLLQLLQQDQFSDGMAQLLLLIYNKINQEEGFYEKLMQLLEP